MLKIFRNNLVFFHQAQRRRATTLKARARLNGKRKGPVKEISQLESRRYQPTTETALANQKKTEQNAKYEASWIAFFNIMVSLKDFFAFICV